METLNKKITITQSDQDRLMNFISFFPKYQNPLEVKQNVKRVVEKLKLAPVDSQKVPSNVVTMNSRVEIKNLRMGKTFILQLVYPDEVEITNNKISIFSPIGSYIFGHSQGDEFTLGERSGKHRYSIEKIIYQPESAGDYHL